MPEACDVVVTILNRQRAHRVRSQPLAAFVKRVATALPPERATSITVGLISDRRMREFNRRFRNRDSTTDVLSFADDGDPDPDGEVHLGDVLISVPSAAQQARERSHSLARELKILALHGYLHLLGYDHEEDDGTMMRLQARLERRLLPRLTVRRGSRSRR